MEVERQVNRLRNCLPEKLETFCKMNLSFLLDCTMKEIEELFGDSSTKHKTPIKKKSFRFFSKKTESQPQIVNRFLSHDQVAKIYQLSEFLQQPENIRTEGLFRKTGNLSRQRHLKEWVNQGTNLHLDDGTFSPHDCANVLKSCISDLPEPLLTEKHFEAHCQIVDMSNNLATGEDRSKVKDKQIKALQLLFLLIPRQNAIVLECLLDLLHKVSNVSENLMTANSLGMVFAPSLICPKKLSPLEFHSMSELFTKAVSFMIDNKPFLFKIPRELAVDVVDFWQEMDETHNHYIFTEKSVSKIDNPAVQCAELKTFAQIPQTPKETNATNAIWQDKRIVVIKCTENNCKKDSDNDLVMEFISGQKEEYYPFKVASRTKICLIAPQKPTAVICPNIKFITRPPK